MTLKLWVYEIERAANAVRTSLVAMPPKLRLFQNNVTPTESTLLAGLTEATFNGYAAVNLDLSAAAVQAGNVATFTAAAIVFTKSVGGTGNNIYGYYVTDAAGATLLWSERDPAAPVDMSTDGATYTVTAKRTGTDV